MTFVLTGVATHAVLLPMRTITVLRGDQRVKKNAGDLLGNSNGAPSPVSNFRINRSRYVIQMALLLSFLLSYLFSFSSLRCRGALFPHSLLLDYHSQIKVTTPKKLVQRNCVTKIKPGRLLGIYPIRDFDARGYEMSLLMN